MPYALGRRALLEGVDLAMRGGEMVGLIGPNGSGKTTLLRVLANLRAPEAGRVQLRRTNRRRDRDARALAPDRLPRPGRRRPLADAGRDPGRAGPAAAPAPVPGPRCGGPACDRAGDDGSRRRLSSDPDDGTDIGRRALACAARARPGRRRPGPAGGRAHRRARSAASAAGDGIAANDRERGTRGHRGVA